MPVTKSQIDEFAYVYDIQSDTLATSYCSYGVGLATLNFDLSNINNSRLFSKKVIKNGKETQENFIENNLLVVSMLDDKMYYDRNADKSSYQYNSVLFINNEYNIIPLSLNIKNIDSALTIDNNEIQTKIDGNTILDINSELSADYTKFRLANNESTGIFKVDNESLMMNDDTVTLSYSIADVIDNIDDHITIMDNVIDQCSNSLDKVIVNFKEYPLYDKKYSCNINQNNNVYYYDETKNNVLMYKKNKDIDHYYYIDYNQKYFKIKIKFIYNYLSSNIHDFNPFDDKNLKITIEDNTSYGEEDRITNNGKIFKLIDFVKYNTDKSYIFNEGIINFDEATNNIFGEVNYICYFDISENLKNVLNNNKIGNVPSCFSFKINFVYYDNTINIESSTYANLDLFIDRYNNELQIHKMLYHDYSVGFNYDGIGNQVGICMITNNGGRYSSNTNSNKPIFMKYFNNENNYIINRISEDILKNDVLRPIYSNNQYNGGESGDNPKPLNMPTLLDGEKNIKDNIVLYKNFNISDIDVDGIWYHMTNPLYINKLFNTKGIYGKYLEYAFNDTYNICGNGLRKGDCYVPCLSELALFYFHGFYPYVNYIEDESYEMVGNTKVVELDSSTLYYNQTDSKMYLYSIDFSDINNVKVTSKKLIGTLKINEYGEYVSTEGKTLHRSISLFKLPDYSILSGAGYYLNYDEELNCEVINYSTKNNISVNIRAYNKYKTITNNDFLVYSNDDTIETSILKINKIQNDMYQLAFSITKYSNKYNDIDIYYIDNDDSFNTEEITTYSSNQSQTINYRRLCKLSVKIE